MMIHCDSRGQAYITEALFAIILLAGVVLVATGTLAMEEPLLTAEDREQQAQMDSELNELMKNSVEDGTVKASVLNWDENNRRYADTETLQDENGYYLALPSDQFGTRLKNFSQHYDNVSLSVEVAPVESESDSEPNELEGVRQSGYPFISTGSAGQTAVVTETYITLYGNDRLQSPPEAHRRSPTSRQTMQGTLKLHNSTTFPVGPATATTAEDEIYNVVRVRVVAWF